MRTKTTKIVGLLLTILVLVGALGAFAITASAADTTVTLSFANKAQRTTFTTSKQVWQQNGIVLTNDKSSSTTNVADYANPARFYAGSKITIAMSGKLIKKIEFVCSSTSYATAMKNSIGAAASASGSTVSVTLATPAESYVVAKLTAQVRMNSIKVTYTEIEVGGCQHENTKATDNANGTHKVTCVDCNEVVTDSVVHTNGATPVDAGNGQHKYTCTACGAGTLQEHKENSTDNGDGTHRNECAICDAVSNEEHNSDTVCTKCGWVAPGQSFELTIKFDDTSKRTEYSTSIQVWEENGIKVTNNKASSTTNVGDYSDPARFYAKSEVIIAFPGMTKIMIDCTGLSSQYVTPWEASIGTNENYTVTIANNIVTVLFNSPVDSLTLVTTAQIRANSITVCGAAPKEEAPLEFDSWSLTLEDNIAINYALKAELITSGLYTAPSVTFVIGDRTIVVTEYNAEKYEGYYVFTLSDIAPHQMGETVTAILSATKDGETVSSTSERTIKEYCMQVLADATKSATLKTLVVDLLNYGAASQTYVGSETTLVNADLTEEQKALGTASITLNTVANAAYQKVENAAATWAGAYLYLVDTVEMNFVFNAASIDGLTVKITTADPANAEATGKTYTITEFTAYGEGAYVASFRGFSAAQMSETVYVTVCDAEGNAISNTYRYSIESYAFAKEQSIDANLATLVVAMMKYGNSAKNYIG